MLKQKQTLQNRDC